MFAVIAKTLTLAVGALTAPIAPCSPVTCYNPAQPVLTATDIAGETADGIVSSLDPRLDCGSGIGAFPVCLPPPSRRRHR